MQAARNVKQGVTQGYVRHRPESTQLYQIVDKYYPDFQLSLAKQDKRLPYYVEREFDEFLRCGRLEHGFLRVVCDDCKHEKLVAISCKRCGFCPSCGSRRMVESAALLVNDILRGYPNRQWVLSLLIPLRLLLARYPCELGKVMSIGRFQPILFSVQVFAKNTLKLWWSRLFNGLVMR